MRVTIGVTTYNRINLLERMAKSYYASNRMYQCFVRIYDDASTEYEEDALRQIFPDAVYIYRQPQNIGSDANIMYMYKDFLESTDDDVFFNADSDLIFVKQWLEKGIDALGRTDGILSVYNTPHHETVAEDGFLLEKEHLGSAGTFFTREALQFLFDSMTEERLNSLVYVGADWGWSKFFKAHGFHLYATKRSFVQHIGFSGYNGTLDRINFGEKFMVDSIINGQILNDTLYDASIMQTQSTRRAYSLFPFELIPQGAKVVIYGYGNTGKDFSEQIEQSGYCKLVAILDENLFDNKRILNPQMLPRLNFEYLILATIHDEVAENMRNVVKKIMPNIGGEVIYKEHNGLIRL